MGAPGKRGFLNPIPARYPSVDLIRTTFPSPLGVVAKRLEASWIPSIPGPDLLSDAPPMHWGSIRPARRARPLHFVHSRHPHRYRRAGLLLLWYGPPTTLQPSIFNCCPFMSILRLRPALPPLHPSPSLSPPSFNLHAAPLNLLRLAAMQSHVLGDGAPLLPRHVRYPVYSHGIPHCVGS